MSKAERGKTRGDRWRRMPSQHTVSRRLMLLLAILVAMSVLAWLNRSAFPRALARNALLQRHEALAARWLDVAISLSPKDAEAHFLRARVLRRQGQIEAALMQLDSALRFGYEARNIERERILAAAQSGQLSYAEPKLPELMSNAPGEGAEICEAFAIGYIKARRIDTARQILALWQDDFPADPQPYFWQGILFQDFMNWKHAITCYRQALELDPKHVLATFALADCLVAVKQPKDALAYYEIAERISDDKPRAWCGQAHCLRILGHREPAIDLLQRSITQSPQHEASLLELAQLDLEEGRFDQAFARLAPLAERQSRNWDIQYAYAVALRGSGKLEDSKQLFETVEYARSQIRKAKDLAEQLDPNDAEMRYRIGNIHLQFGQPTEGLWWLNSALDIEPGHLEAQAAISEYYKISSRVTPTEQPAVQD